MKNNIRPVLLSIKPQWSDMILDGVKTVELRRVFNEDLGIGTPLIIYSSSPAKEIVGVAFVETVKRRSVATLWKEFGQQSGVPYGFFMSYFEGRSHGYAVVLNHPTKLDSPIPLSRLKDLFDFRPPQSYMYADANICNAVFHPSASAA
jgi:predicted transcriptional regulator